MQLFEKELRDFVINNFLYGREGNFSNEDSFLENGIIDSTGMLELIGFLETQHGIKVEDDELLPENLDSITKILDFVARKNGTNKAGGVLAN